MKKTSPLLLIICKISLLACSLGTAQAQILHYTFDQGTGSAINSGSAGSVGDAAFGVNAGYSASGGGVTGQPGNYAYQGIASTQSWAGTAGALSAMNGLTALTISGWINANSWTSGARIAQYQFGFSGFTLRLGAGNQLDLRVGDFTVPHVSTGTAYATGSMIYYAVTWDGTNGNINFYSGTTSSSATLQSTLTGGKIGAYDSGGVNTSNPFMIGNSSKSGFTPADGLNGRLDDLQVFGSALNLAALESIRLSAIPEPSVSMLVFLGLACAAGFKRGARRVARL